VTATVPVGARSAVPRRQNGWLVAGLVLAASLIAFGGFEVVSLLSHEPFDRHHVWAGAISQLDISDGDGSVTIVGSGRSGATVEATGDQGLHKPTDVETLSAGRLAIKSSCDADIGGSWCDLNYRITVPTGAQVLVHTGDGAIHVTDLTGVATLSSGDGNVDVAGGDGALDLSSSDGDVRLTGSHSRRVTASSGDGGVTLGLLAVPTDVEAHSGDGDVDVTVPTGPTFYEVGAHSGYGSPTVQVRTAPSSPNRINASSGDGDVTVTYGT
jgi:hypothetical protein